MSQISMSCYCPNSGVWRKELGHFHERGLEIAQLRMDTGARCEIDAMAKAYLLYAIDGAGTVCAMAWATGSAIEYRHGEQAALHALRASEFYVLGLPTFDEQADGERGSR